MGFGGGEKSLDNFLCFTVPVDTQSQETRAATLAEPHEAELCKKSLA